MLEASASLSQSDDSFLSYQLRHPSLAMISRILNDLSSNPIRSFRRRHLFEWLNDLCHHFDISTPTSLTACYYLDVFLHKKPEIQDQVLELFAGVAVSLAHKSKNGVSINPNSMYRTLGGRFSVDAIVTAEKYMLEVIEWNLVVFTVADIIESLCESTFCGGYSKICKLASDIATVAYWDVKIAEKGSVCLAVSCLLEVMRRLNFTQLQENWIISIQELINLDVNEIFSVVQEIEEKLINFSSG
jgi:hypothetical protein